MSLYTSFKEKVFSRANRAISFQLYSTKKIDPDPFKKEKVAQSLSSNNISTKLKL